MLGTKIPELMDFPSEITFKVIGEHSHTLHKKVEQIMHDHKVSPFHITSKPSKQAKYISLSVNFTIKSPEQMESLYKTLASIPEVRMVI